MPAKPRKPKKAGRPTVGREPGEVISVRLEPELLRRLDAFLERRRRDPLQARLSRSDVIRGALVRLLDAEGRGGRA